MNSRFRIQASCLQLPAAEITTSVAMKNAAANMEKISTVYERLRREHVDDPQEDDELDAIEAELAAGLVSAGVGRFTIYLSIYLSIYIYIILLGFKNLSSEIMHCLKCLIDRCYVYKNNIKSTVHRIISSISQYNSPRHRMAVTLSRQRVKKTTEYEDDDTSEESEDGFSDVSSVGDLPKDLQDRMMEFNSWFEDNKIKVTRIVILIIEIV